MPCLLDDERLAMLLENLENDSTHCMFRLSDLVASEDFEELAQASPEIKAFVEAAQENLEAFQDRLQDLELSVIELDDTEYFEDGGFSNMGWVMLSRYLRSGIQVPLVTLEQYLIKRTKGDPRVRGALTRLLRQDLVKRSRLLVPRVDGFYTSETIETCISLTDKGREACDDDRFVYKPTMTDGKKMCNLNTDNVIPFRREASESPSS